MELPGRSPWMVWYTFDLCFVYPRRHSSSACLPQPFHSQPTHGTLNLTPLLLFIHLRTNQCPQPKSKAQYIIWAFISTIAPQNSGFFPFIREEKVGFWFLRVKTIYFFDLHVWKHCFMCPVTTPDTSKPVMPHLMLQAMLYSPYPMVRDKSYGWYFPLEFKRDDSHSILPSI